MVNGHKGCKVLLRQGVPQGGVLSPSLFILFINDVAKEMPKGIRAALYADDFGTLGHRGIRNNSSAQNAVSTR